MVLHKRPSRQHNKNITGSYIHFQCMNRGFSLIERAAAAPPEIAEEFVVCATYYARMPSDN
jgi:hypothetical protein